MDLAIYIHDLLFEHDCVIVPNFGGFIANYKPSEIDHVLHTVSPPSKSIAFNKNLSANDGLLINYIAKAEQIPYTVATEKIAEWVTRTQILLTQNEEINLTKIGKFSNDIERNLQFSPNLAVNFLKSSYGLRTIVAAPILRGKTADTIEVYEKHRASYELKNTANGRRKSLATIILLFLVLFGLIGLMNSNVHPESLNLNSASVLSCLETILHRDATGVVPVLKVAPVLSETVKDATVESSDTVATAPISENGNDASKKIATTTPNEVGYYVIVGVFSEEKNVSRAEDSILAYMPDAILFKEQHNGLMRVGYRAGNTLRESLSVLTTAQSKDSDCWLLTKQ